MTVRICFLQVAEHSGGEQAGQQVAFLWAKSLGGDSAVKLLSKFGLLETCIDYACDSYQVNHRCILYWMSTNSPTAS